MKFIALAGILLSMSTCGCVSTDTSSDDRAIEGTTTQQLGSSGPFANEQAVINYWNNFSTDSAIQIFFNGKDIYSRLGFGPGIIDQYFVCISSNNNIYESCPAASFAYFNGYSNFNTLVSVCPSNSTIYKDNVLFRSGTSGVTEFIATCLTQRSSVGQFKYYKVMSETGFSPPYSSGCYL